MAPALRMTRSIKEKLHNFFCILNSRSLGLGQDTEEEKAKNCSFCRLRWGMEGGKAQTTFWGGGRQRKAAATELGTKPEEGTPAGIPLCFSVMS